MKYCSKGSGHKQSKDVKVKDCIFNYLSLACIILLEAVDVSNDEKKLERFNFLGRA